MTGPVTVAGCRDCLRDLDHCHAALVVHVGGWAECTDPGCDARLERHVLVLTCTDVDQRCTCHL